MTSKMVEFLEIPSNVRRWKEEIFKYWRCPNCQSYHISHQPDLDKYYQDYPFARQKLDFFTKKIFKNYFLQLKPYGFSSSKFILDYGCGSGIKVEYLQQQGYFNAVGYDPYSIKYNDKSVLDKQYDFIISQDVIEHSPTPKDFLIQLHQLLKPNGLLLIGTPRANGINPNNPLASFHTFHAPFHLHLFSERALLELSQTVGFSTEVMWVKHQMDTPFPFLNWNFFSAYILAKDNMLDTCFEPPDVKFILMRMELLIKGLFGYWISSRNQDMMILLRKKS